MGAMSVSATVDIPLDQRGHIGVTGQPPGRSRGINEATIRLRNLFSFTTLTALVAQSFSRAGTSTQS